MSYNFDYSDIKQQVLDFMRSLDIQPYDERKIIIDGELHRYRTHDDKASQTSGAYCIHTDGIPAGFVQDWRKGIKEDWRFDTSGFIGEKRAYFNSEEFRKRAEQERREAEAKRREKQSQVAAGDSSSVAAGAGVAAGAAQPARIVVPIAITVNNATNFLFISFPPF